MFSHLLVPLDGSPAAEAAVSYAAALPGRIVTLLTVIPAADDPGYDWLTDVADEAHHDQQRKHARAYLETVAAGCRQRGRTVELVVAEGDPAEQIIEAAHRANLVIMTSHGYGSKSAAAYGRVVDRVARYSNRPVLVVRGVAATESEVKRIVLPLDGSETADDAAPLAMELASQIGAPIHLISVVDPALFGPDEVDSAKRLAAAYLASEGERMRSHAIEITAEVRIGTPAAQIIAAIDASDLVVMTAFGAGTGRRWQLGGVADKLIRSAPAPVLVVRPAAAIAKAA